jgi:hypothetical protein
MGRYTFHHAEIFDALQGSQVFLNVGPFRPGALLDELVITGRCGAGASATVAVAVRDQKTDSQVEFVASGRHLLKTPADRVAVISRSTETSYQVRIPLNLTLQGSERFVTVSIQEDTSVANVSGMVQVVEGHPLAELFGAGRVAGQAAG